MPASSEWEEAGLWTLPDDIASGEVQRSPPVLCTQEAEAGIQRLWGQGEGEGMALGTYGPWASWGLWSGAL